MTEANILEAQSVSAFYLLSYRVLNDSVLIARDNCASCKKKKKKKKKMYGNMRFVEKNASIDGKIDPIQLALNHSRRGNCAGKM